MEIPSQPTPFTVFSLKYENRETAGKSGEYSTKKRVAFFSACIHGCRIWTGNSRQEYCIYFFF